MTERGGIKVFEGRVYARIRWGTAEHERFEVRLPWAKPDELEPAYARSALITEMCRKLADGGRKDLIRSTARNAANATSPKLLETIRKAAENLSKLGAAGPAESMTTFEDVADMWTKGDLHKRYPDQMRRKTDFRLERGRLKRYVFPLIKDVPISAFERSHGDLVMAKLPPKRIKTPAASRQIAQLVYRILNLAIMPLGLIKVNPLPKGWLPRVDQHKHYTCLFPHEEKKLVACADVEEEFRLFIGVLDREGMRVSELADSEWWQWNLEIGTFTATKTKTNDPRMWALKPDVSAAMRLWHARFGKTKSRPFIDVAPDQKTKDQLASRLRESLSIAGVTRTELFVSTEHTGALRAHDMRATFVTISIAEGRTEAWIRDRTAHKTTAMIDRYRRTARQFVELELGSLDNLVEALGWAGDLRVISAVAVGDANGSSARSVMGSGAGIRTPIRGSKSRAGSHPAPPTPSNDDGSDGEVGAPGKGSPGDPPGFRRLRGDVQTFVANQVAKAYAAVFAGDEPRTIAPLAKAAKAIDRGRVPGRRRAGGRAR